MMLFENRMLRRIFGPKENEVTGVWRKLRNEELHKFYTRNIITMMKSRRMTLTGYVVRLKARRNGCRILMGKPEGKRTVGRRSRRWVNNLKIGLRWDGVV
jgi:hypothetical protein